MRHSRRAQILMEPAEYDRLEQIARVRRTSVAELIRSAVRSQYLDSRDERLAAVERIASMNLPGDWTAWKRDVEEAYDAGLR